jgi:hypothetical protein
MVRIACVGDSITEGFGLPDATIGTLSYPGVLASMLPDDDEVLSFASDGLTMTKRGNLPFWLSSEYDRALASSPDIVVLMLVLFPPSPVSHHSTQHRILCYWDRNVVL